MAENDWGKGYEKSIGIFLNGAAIPNPNPRGEPATDDSLHIICNAHHEPLHLTLTGNDWGEAWMKELDTYTGWLEEDKSVGAGERIKVEGRSLAVLRQEP